MTEFTIAAAQIAVSRGDLSGNLAAHTAAVVTAAAAGVSVLVFPELSLTGYEPDLAAALAFDPGDARLRELKELAVRHRVTFIAGAPVRTGGKPAIGALVFSPTGQVDTYLKMHLGTTEGAYFTTGSAPLLLELGGTHRLGVAVCADTSRPTHPETYVKLGADIYAAGVFFNAEWYPQDAPRFAQYAQRFGVLTLMANHGASVGTLTSVGGSAIWAPGGGLLARADGVESTLVAATLSAGRWTGQTLPVAPVS